MNKTLTTLSMATALMISGCASHEAEVEHKAASEEKAAAHGASHEKHWDYAQNGPAHWGEFSSTCVEEKS